MDARELAQTSFVSGHDSLYGVDHLFGVPSVFEKDHALVRRFQKIDVNEPSIEEAIQILGGLKSRFEEHHGVQYTQDALRAAVELSSKHLTDRFLPDKAIDVIDEAGAKARLKKNAQHRTETAVLDHNSIVEIVAQIARIPARSVSTSQKVRLKNLKSDLKLSIFGQDHAVEALVTSIRLARSGLRTGERPVGCFLFLWPNGGRKDRTQQAAFSLPWSAFLALRYERVQ